VKAWESRAIGRYCGGGTGRGVPRGRPGDGRRSKPSGLPVVVALVTRSTSTPQAMSEEYRIKDTQHPLCSMDDTLKRQCLLYDCGVLALVILNQPENDTTIPTGWGVRSPRLRRLLWCLVGEADCGLASGLACARLELAGGWLDQSPKLLLGGTEAQETLLVLLVESLIYHRIEPVNLKQRCIPSRYLIRWLQIQRVLIPALVRLFFSLGVVLARKDRPAGHLFGVL
jgi:hypothetical protein